MHNAQMRTFPAQNFLSPPTLPTNKFIEPAALKRTVQLFCIDLSGTVHVGTEMIPGAADALKILKDNGVNHKFLTNTTRESTSSLIASLAQIGINVERRDLFSSLSVTRDYIIRKKFRPFLLIEEGAMEDFEDINVDNPDSVVIGLAPHKLDYWHLNEAFRILMRSPGPGNLIATHKGRYHKVADGLSIGPGAFVQALEFSTGKAATIAGKPNPNFFGNVLNSCGCNPRTSIMIGDDVHDDIIGALQSGMNACLVKTGKYRAGDENTLFHPIGEPNPVHVRDRAIIADSLLHAVRLLT